MKDYRVEEVTITANSIVVRLPEPVLNEGCEKYNLATTIYTISLNYLTCLDNDLNKSIKFNVQTYKQHYEFQNLTPFTEYTIKLALSNFYFDKLSIRLQFGKGVILKTAGKLNAPEDITVRVLTPTLAAVYWMPPKELNCVAVNYEVHWILILNILFPNSTRKISYQRDKQLINQPERAIGGKYFLPIQPLRPEQEYLVYVRVYPINFSNFSTDSSNKSIHMYSEPNNLILSGISTNSINISWIPTLNLNIHYTLEYKNVEMRKWQIADNFEMNNNQIIYYIKNLLPRTLYQFRLILRYPDYKEDFIWPSDERFTFKTLGKQLKTL
ncbi:proto-oncogene tyrosine-protein kinase ros [Lasius niger]|uniref:Proto-oncogene tyrosine-protein kinase ros n=1 Tax=Lasius niger TaxID=67767 RepID=A0A0J7K0X3_LASNI|nr:proto-oncogene tyrosine-protein kinase ros [Lasius niger]